MFFELATGDFLFDPKKEKGDVRNSGVGEWSQWSTVNTVRHHKT